MATEPVAPISHMSVSRKPRLLDWFCCQGGAATGYARAGFDVVGIDTSYGRRFMLNRKAA